MKTFRIEAPTVQNWSCHGCTECCRGRMQIDLTEEEKSRIEKQGWTKASGVDPSTMFVEEGGKFRLGHRADGACVFLEAATGKCRIHSQFGEDQKPRACQLYPLTLHPVGAKLVVGLRYSCPSAVANSGKTLAEQIPSLRKLANLIVPDNYSACPPPPILCGGVIDWPDFLRFVSALDKTVADEQQSMSIKLQRALHWLTQVEKAEFDSITGKEADEILGALIKNAAHEVSSYSAKPAPPTRFGRVLFRTLVFLYARKDGMSELHAGAGYRLRMLGSMMRFARASGTVPQINGDLKAVEFTAIEASFGPLPPEVEALLTRFFRVKIQSLHFCGRAFYDLPLIEGFRNLALLYPVILWLARWHAAGEGRFTLTEKDVAKAITIADHHHGYSPALGTNWSRQRVRLLAQRDDIARLCSALAL